MTELAKQHCQENPPVLTSDQAKAMLGEINTDWLISDDGKQIVRSFGFSNFHQTMAFVNALAWVAHEEDHHPDLEVGYKQCRVHYSTHSAGGLSANDFICAARIDRLLD